MEKQTALMAGGLFPQLKSHFILGKKHGITKSEAVEIVTQLAFYSGWAKAWSSFPLIEEVYGTNLSATTISNITDEAMIEGKEWFSRIMYYSPNKVHYLPILPMKIKLGN